MAERLAPHNPLTANYALTAIRPWAATSSAPTTSGATC